MPFDFTIKAGSSSPPLRVKIVNENNSAVSLVGAKGVQFSMRKATDHSSMIITKKTSSVTDSVNGYIQHSWSLGSTSGYDDQEVEAEFRISLSDNKILKVPTMGYLKGKITDSLA